MTLVRPVIRGLRYTIVSSPRRAYATRPPSNRKPPSLLALVAILAIGFGAFSLVSKQRASDPFSTRKGNQFSKAGVTPTPEGMADQEKSQAKLSKGGATPTFDSNKIAVVSLHDLGSPRC